MKKTETLFHARTGMIALAAIATVGISHDANAQGFLGGLFKKNKKSNADDVATVNPPGTDALPTTTVESNSKRSKRSKPSNPRTVLTSGQLSAQEAAASQVLAKAQAEEGAASYGKAFGTYKGLVKSYPRTQSAAEAQYKMGEMRQAEGNDKKAFEEYQELITVYKNSKRFTDALNRQFGIAEKLRGATKKGFGGIGAAIQPSRLVEMFQQIANSAPYTDFAPRALLNIGYIHSEQRDQALAIMAFQQVADSYQNTDFASEAQFQVFKLRGQMAKKSFSPVEDRAQEEAGMDFVGKNPDDKRASDVKAELGQIEDRKLDKLFNIGRFYESREQYKSAAVYYRKIVEHPGSTRYNDAKERLSALTAVDPSLATAPRPGVIAVAPQQIALPGEEPAAAPKSGSGGLKKMFSGFGKKEEVAEEASYLGPPPPTIKTKKPSMRTSNDNVIPIPNDDPVTGN